MFGISVGIGPVRLYARTPAPRRRCAPRRGGGSVPWWAWPLVGPCVLALVILYGLYIWPFVAFARHRRRRRVLLRTPPGYAVPGYVRGIYPSQPPVYQPYPRGVLPPGYGR